MNFFRSTASFSPYRNSTAGKIARCLPLLLFFAVPALGHALTVGVPTTIALSANATTVACGADVTLTAHLTPFIVGLNLSNGLTVNFYNGANIAATAVLQNGTATAHVAARVGGTLSITAAFLGNVSFLASTSTVVRVNVGACTPPPPPPAISTTLRLTSVLCDGHVTLVVSLFPYAGGSHTTNGENITFYSNNTVLGTGVLASGFATLTIPTPPPGTYDVASFHGDAFFTGSISNSVQPGGAGTGGGGTGVLSTILTLHATTSGSQLSVTADLSPFNNGNVSCNGELITFFSNGRTIGTGVLLNGRATLNAVLPTNGAAILAVYAGDRVLSASASNTVQINVTSTTRTSLIVYANVNPSVAGAALTFTASLYPYYFNGNSTNGESVTFYNNGVSIGTGVLRNGLASLTLSSLPVGNHNISAIFHFDTHFSGSSSSLLSVSISAVGGSTPIPTSIVLRADALSIISNTGLKLTATVSPAAQNGRSLNGELVRFSVNGTVLGTAAIVNGVATFNVLPNTLPLGLVELNCNYSGDAAFTGSTSNFLSVAVVL